MASKYQKSQREKSIKLITEKNPVFYGSSAGKKFRGIERDFVLAEDSKNLFEPIKNEVIEYFNQNCISWWGGKKPTGHVLSSQIACLNHLFLIRSDKNAVLRILKNISVDFIDILKINSDKYSNEYIQFEAISSNDNLNEKVLNRGSNCTSIDALIYAVHKNGSKWLIPIEWKYTEHYDNKNKAVEGLEKNGEKSRGEERKRRYSILIVNSSQLKSSNDICYYYEPFYQLMRQTLWAEQVVNQKNKEIIKADDYLHVHVIPSENTDLLNKKYKCSNKDMETTWKDQLIDSKKYQIITPQKLLSGISEIEYDELLKYLTIRYWKD